MSRFKDIYSKRLHWIVSVPVKPFIVMHRLVQGVIRALPGTGCVGFRIWGAE